MKDINRVNILEKFSLFEDLWSPKIIGEINDHYVKVCKLQDDFVWHAHEKEDEMFMVIKGTLFIDFRDQSPVEVTQGEMLIVPKGVEHRPHTNGETVFVLLFEQKTTLNTGNIKDGMTVDRLAWI